MRIGCIDIDNSYIFTTTARVDTSFGALLFIDDVSSQIVKYLGTDMKLRIFFFINLPHAKHQFLFRIWLYSMSFLVCPALQHLLQILDGQVVWPRASVHEDTLIVEMHFNSGALQLVPYILSDY